MSRKGKTRSVHASPSPGRESEGGRPPVTPGDNAPDRESPSLMIEGIREAAARARREMELEALADADPDIAFLRENLQEYEVITCIYRGGQGAVYRAIDRETGEQVAVKILLDGPLASPRSRHRFAQEIEMIAHIDHPNIVKLRDSGSVRGRHFLVMDYIEGYPLPDFVLLNNLSLRQRIELMIKVCRAVSFAHQHGIIHRDLKPGNILVDAGGEPHILDFGLAKIIADQRSNGQDSITQTGQVVGTLPFVAPERISGSPIDVDVRADIYALGVMLFHLVTGSHPFPVNETTDVIRHHIIFAEPRTLRQTLARDDLEDAIRIGEVSDDLEAIVAMSLEKDVRLRYQSADALSQDLTRLLEGDAVHAKSDRQFYILVKALKRYRAHAVVALCAVFFLIASLVVVTLAWRSAERSAQIAQAGMEMGAFLKLGVDRGNQDNVQRAIELTRRAIEIGTPFREDTTVRCALFDAHCRIAKLYFEEDDVKSALPHVTKAITLAQELKQTNPRQIMRAVAVGTESEASEYIDSKLGFSMRLRSQLAMRAEQYSDAVKSARQAVLIFRKLSNTTNDSRGYRTELANTLGLLGKAYRHDLQPDMAWKYYEESYRIKAEITRSSPDDINHALSYAISVNKLCVWHIDRKTDESNMRALMYLEEAESVLARVLESDQAEMNARTIRRLREALDANREILDNRSVGIDSISADPE